MPGKRRIALLTEQVPYGGDTTLEPSTEYRSTPRKALITSPDGIPNVIDWRALDFCEAGVDGRRTALGRVRLVVEEHGETIGCSYNTQHEERGRERKREKRREKREKERQSKVHLISLALRPVKYHAAPSAVALRRDVVLSSGRHSSSCTARLGPRGPANALSRTCSSQERRGPRTTVVYVGILQH